MTKIEMKNPIVELDGDEMTRVLWQMIKEIVLTPYLDLKTEYYDLGLENREKTADQVTMAAAQALKREQIGVKCATITPNQARMEEYNLREMYKSPNGTIRAFLGGTVFRQPLVIANLKPLVKTWLKPITIARHAYGDLYSAVEMQIVEAGQVELLFTNTEGVVNRKTVHEFTAPGVVLGMHNLDESITDFARACFRYAFEEKKDLWFAAKETISKKYDQRFKEIFQEIFAEEYAEKFAQADLVYFYTLIDDLVARLMRSRGGMVVACQNYDGDVLSDLVAAAFGSLAMMTSVLVSPRGEYLYEAAHGTVQRHYYRHLQGEQTSTNPLATLFAWSGALRKRGEIDHLPRLINFAATLEKEALIILEQGYLTGDLALLAEKPVRQILKTEEFLLMLSKKIAQNLIK